MAFENIVLQTTGEVAVITFNKPDSRNPMTGQTKDELIAALDEVTASDTVRAVILTGTGAAFCAGGDLKSINQMNTPQARREMMEKSQKLLRRLINVNKPVIAAVNGDAAGIGCNLALAADFIIASEKARFSEIFIRIGLIPDFGGMYFLPRIVGLSRAKEMVYTGKMATAQEGKDMGFVLKVVPHDELGKAAMEYAQRLAKLPTRAIAKAKALFNRVYDMTLEEVLREEIDTQEILTNTLDHQEGIRAFLEKRDPKFQGK